MELKLFLKTLWQSNIEFGEWLPTNFSETSCEWKFEKDHFLRIPLKRFVRETNLDESLQHIIHDESEVGWATSTFVVAPVKLNGWNGVLLIAVLKVSQLKI